MVPTSSLALAVNLRFLRVESRSVASPASPPAVVSCIVVSVWSAALSKVSLLSSFADGECEQEMLDSRLVADAGDLESLFEVRLCLRLIGLGVAVDLLRTAAKAASTESEPVSIWLSFIFFEGLEQDEEVCVCFKFMVRGGTIWQAKRRIWVDREKEGRQ